MSTYTTKLLNLKRGQYILYVLMLAFVVILFWVGGSLLRSQRTTGISVELKKLALPLNPNIDISVFTTISGKRVYNPQTLRDFPIYMVVRSDDGKTQQVVPVGSGTNRLNVNPIVPVPIVAESSENAAGNSSTPTSSATSSAQQSTTPSATQSTTQNPVQNAIQN